MNLVGSEQFLPHLSSSAEDDFLIKMINLIHDPDGRRLDSELLLLAVETIMCHATTTQGSYLHLDDFAKSNICSIDEVGSEDSLGHTIYKISREMLLQCLVEGNLHAKTMILFGMLEHYRWDAKVVLILAAFVTIYSEFWLIMQVHPHNPLAASLAMLKQLPGDLTTLKPRFKALTILVKIMVDVTKCIIKFEGLPLQHVALDNEALCVTKSRIYTAAYWIIRSALTCASEITNLIAFKNEQVHSNSETIAAWELSSLVCRLSSICSHLRQLVDVCDQRIETNLHNKLLNLFKETHTDNQEVLRLLFPLKNDLPLKNCSSQAQLGVSELKDKIVILLVSKPELMPIEGLLLLVQQAYDHPLRIKLEGSYEIVWLPISHSNTWTHVEEGFFNFLSDYLPWYSIHRPWLLRSAVINFIKQVWSFKEDPLMVVLDSQGMVTNINAIDMMLIWGVGAYPFSATRERELWEEDKWNLQLLMDGIDPLLAMWVEEERNLCIYGSDNLDWIREFSAKVREITSAGGQLEMVYVGKKNPSEGVKDILATIVEEKLSGSLTSTKMRFFWLRLESMRKSKLRLGHTFDDDFIIKGVSRLLDIDENDNEWVVLGKGSNCLNLIENVDKLGLVNEIRAFLEPPPLVAEPCDHYSVVPFAEELIQKTAVCEKCKRPMEKFVLYKCDTQLSS
ncbi:protein SIEVE ELEMENT OCCLUSION C [Cornus florida]|uniref:protein SIEVE ELEMENT OCCLUSION C n=1 Tax=Cornus florida TaxID=4283 RepID=UPI00289CCF8D|nr:protein SIEVE ELEMENT OCCLUSION C [Cornus florida]